MTTTTETTTETDRHQKMFGMGWDELQQAIDGCVEDSFMTRGRSMNDRTVDLAFSMLSDVQALIELGHSEKARKLINRAKVVLDRLRDAE